MQVDQAIANIMYRCLGETRRFELFLVAEQTISPFLNLHLRIKLRFEPIDIAVVRVERVLLSPFRIKTKDIAEEV